MNQNNNAPTVFVVDDDEEVRESLELLLLAERIQVETYESAQAFLDRREYGAHGCMVLDVRMPGMTGVELLEKLAQRNCRLPTIMISASSDKQTRHRATRAGAIDFIHKPYDTKQLLRRIQQMLESVERNGKEEL